MDAYFGSLKIYEVIGYAGIEVPDGLKEFLGDHYAMVRFGNENGTPFIVRTDEIEIRD